MPPVRNLCPIYQVVDAAVATVQLLLRPWYRRTPAFRFNAAIAEREHPVLNAISARDRSVPASKRMITCFSVSVRYKPCFAISQSLSKCPDIRTKKLYRHIEWELRRGV